MDENDALPKFGVELFTLGAAIMVRRCLPQENAGRRVARANCLRAPTAALHGITCLQVGKE